MAVFKAAQFVVLFVFAVVISDVKNKRGMVSHIDARLTVALKICVFVLAGIYCYTLVAFDQLMILDLAALCLTSAGALLILKAKLDLGKHHTWTGYHFRKTKLVVDGVYAYIRHPLYTGVHIFFFGTFATTISHAPFILSMVMLATLVYVTSFLVISAINKPAGAGIRRYVLRV